MPAEPKFFLGYKPVPFKTSEFAPNELRKAECQEFMEEDLARSGLTWQDAHASIHPWGAKGVDAAYLIPYSDMDGRFLNDEAGHSKMHRIRLKLNGFADPKLGKYIGPSREQVGDLCAIPYVPPGGCGDGDVLYVCEGEKKALAVRKAYGVAVLGIGGCWNWKHEWVFKLCERYERIVIIPDGDIHRYDIAKAYGTFAEAVGGILLDPPDKIDDMIVDGLTEQQFYELPVFGTSVQSADSLIEQYGVTYEEVKKSKRIIANETNCYMLMKKHPAFPEIWRNVDNHSVGFGEDCSEKEVIEYFQYNLAMPHAKTGPIRTAIGWVANANERSPWRDWLEGLEWDGVERLGGLFVDYCGADDTEFNRELARRWLVASVARQYSVEPCDYMVIAQGGQGIGKSRFARVLFRGEAVSIIGKEGQQKDFLMKMHMGKCAVFEELSAMNHKDLEHMKAMLSEEQDPFRVPYDREPAQHPRRFVIYGSTNRTSFLNYDESGYRRWGVVQFRKVDLEKLEADVGQLWAEAVALYRAGGVEYSWISVPNEVVGDFIKNEPIIETFQEYVENGRFGGLVVEYKGERVLMATVRQFFEAMDMRFSDKPTYLITTLKEFLKGQQSGFYYRDDVTVNGIRRRKVFISTFTPTVTHSTHSKF